MRLISLFLLLISTIARADWSQQARDLGVLLNKPADIEVADGKFSHTKDVDLVISEEAGRQFYFDGIVPALESKATFLEATKEVRTMVVDYPYIQNAPCAWTVSSVVRYAAKHSNVLEITRAFPLMKGGEPIHTCTIEDEHTLKRLGFSYYSKKKYIAPKGAIGLLAGRWPHECHIYSNLGSGHIYFILVDGEKDLIADNLTRYGIYYKGPGGDAGTEGFWLPPGVYPSRR